MGVDGALRQVHKAFHPMAGKVSCCSETQSANSVDSTEEDSHGHLVHVGGIQPVAPSQQLQSKLSCSSSHHLCLPLQPHPMIVDHSLQPFSELERDGGHHKTLVRHKLCLPFLPGCDLPVFSLHSLNDILVISIFWFWLTPVCVDKSNNIRLVSKLCFDLGHLSSLVKHGIVALKVELLLHLMLFLLCQSSASISVLSWQPGAFVPSTTVTFGGISSSVMFWRCTSFPEPWTLSIHRISRHSLRHGSQTGRTRQRVSFCSLLLLCPCLHLCLH